MPLSICVYSSSSDHLEAVHYRAARELGRLMAGRGHTLVYGGGNNGLMGAMALQMQ
ncbi:MAG: TIGR00730 family Rossman fold protein, partial [Nitrospiraceae bacterium]|nr:TIGR00730 family Rossman fold protein [Nitrospiraceae bacterium]